MVNCLATTVSGWNVAQVIKVHRFLAELFRIELRLAKYLTNSIRSLLFFSRVEQILLVKSNPKSNSDLENTLKSISKLVWLTDGQLSTRFLREVVKI